MAERFTYLPYLGLFIVISHYAGILSSHIKNKSRSMFSVLCIFSLVIVLLSIYQTQKRCRVWKNDGTLWFDVISKNPMHPIGYKNFGAFLNIKDKPVLAERFIDKALDLDPNFYGAYFHKGNILFKLGKPDEAIRFYTIFLGVHPQHIEANNNRGSSYFIKGEYEKALEDFNKVIQHTPQNMLALLNRANVHIKLGQYQEALIDLLVVLEVSPERKDIRAKINDVKKLINQ